MYNVRVERSAGYAGIAFVGLGIVATLLTGFTPAASSSASEIAAYLGSHHLAWMIAAWLALPGIALFLWFIVQLSAFLRLVPGLDDGLPAYMLAAGLLSSAFILIVTLAEVALGSRPAGDIDPASLRILWDVFNGADALFLMPVAVMVFAASHSGWRHASLPAWAMYWGYLTAVACAAASASIFWRSGFFAIGGAGALLIGGIPLSIWIVMASTVLIARPKESASSV